MRETKELKLPEPAAGLWGRIRETVHELGSRRPGTRIEPHIGGGTTLAARWGHRRSTDIDVTLPGDASLADLTRNDEENLARRVGGTAEVENLDEIKVLCDDGALHLARLRPHARGAESRVQMDGRPETLLATSQILAGKLDRAKMSPVRDVFDIVAAAKADGAGLATAVSMLDPRRAEQITARWRDEDGRFARDAETQLRDVAPAFETDRETLGSDAAQALEDHRYRRLEIRIDGREIAITKTIANGALPEERYRLSEARQALAASGIEEHLDANGPVMPVKVAIAIDTMAKYTRDGLLYDSDDPGTRDQVTFPNKHFEPGWKPFAKMLEERKATRFGGDPGIEAPPPRGRQGGETGRGPQPGRSRSREDSEPSR